jgi:hypothetical protein
MTAPRRAFVMLALTLVITPALAATAAADCIGEEAFGEFYTDVQATNQNAFVMFGSASAETPGEPLADHGEAESSTSLYELPSSGSSHPKRIPLGVRHAFTTAPTLFEAGGKPRVLVWREGPGRGKTALLGAPAGHPLKSVLSPAGSAGFAPIAVGAMSGGGYVMLAPAPEGGGSASLQIVNADGTLGPSTSIGAAAGFDPTAVPAFSLTQASDGAIWVAGPNLLARWLPGGSFTVLEPLPGPYAMGPASEGGVWVLSAAESGAGMLLIHVAPNGTVSRQRIPSGEGEDMANGEELPMAALATHPDGSAVVAYGTSHGALLASTAANGVLGKPRRLSSKPVLSIEDLDLQPGSGTPFVSVTGQRTAAIYEVGAKLRVTSLPGVSRGFDSVRATLGFAPDRRAWIVWTVRRGNVCDGSERSRAVWATLSASGRLSPAHTLGEGTMWVL